MFLWNDHGKFVDLVSEDSLEELKSYERITLLPGEVKFIGDEDEGDYEESYKYKLKTDDDIYVDSWKVQSLRHFAKVLQNKKVDPDVLHCIMTSSTDGFTESVRANSKILIMSVYEDPEWKGTFLSKVVDEIEVIYHDYYQFVSVRSFQQFKTECTELLPAVQEFMNWYEKGMPEQTIELWNITTLAEMFEKQKQNLHRDYKNGKLPAPFATVGGTPYWHPKQIGELSRAIKN